MVYLCIHAALHSYPEECVTASNWQQPTVYRSQETREDLSLALCGIDCLSGESGELTDTSWQRSHLSHQRRPTALSSSNFLRRYQIVPVIASSQPGSSSFHDSMLFPLPPPPLIHSLSIILKGALKVVTNLGLLREINRVGKPSVWSLTNWGEMIEMFISDYSPCRPDSNILESDKICKHSKSLMPGRDSTKGTNWFLLSTAIDIVIPVYQDLPICALSQLGTSPGESLDKAAICILIGVIFKKRWKLEWLWKWVVICI